MKGNLLKSCGPSKTWYADFWGWGCDVWSIFNAYCACLINLHHSTDGKISSHVMRPAILYLLKVCIARSAALMQ